MLGCELNAYWQGRASIFSTSTPGISPETIQVVFSVYQNLFPWISSDKYEVYVTILRVFGSALESMGLESGLVSKSKQGI